VDRPTEQQAGALGSSARGAAADLSPPRRDGRAHARDRLVEDKTWSGRSLAAASRTMLGVVLAAAFPCCSGGARTCCSLQRCLSPILRDKHPASSAAPAAEVWAESGTSQARWRGACNKGPGNLAEDLQLFIKSGAMAEETYFSFPTVGPRRRRRIAVC